MREIEFRGMTIDGKWVCGLLAHAKHKSLCGEIGWFISNKGGAPFAYDVRPETIGQFTGLIDKNDKKIFDGDIVEFVSSFDGTRTRTEVSDYTRVDRMRTGFYPFAAYNLCPSDVLVIGNIYENPELLGES